MADLLRTFWDATEYGGLGRLTKERDRSMNTMEPVATNEVLPLAVAPPTMGRLPGDTALPGVPIRHLEWTGSDIVERNQTDKDAVDAFIAAEDAVTDAADDVSNSTIDYMTPRDAAVWKTLFDFANEIRVLNSQSVLTKAQFEANVILPNYQWGKINAGQSEP